MMCVVDMSLLSSLVRGEFQSYLEIHMPDHFVLFLVSSGPLESISAECKNFYPLAYFS